MGSHAILKSKQEVDRILKDVYIKEDLHQPKVEISSGCNKGDGFLSSVNKITITENGKKLHLIMKCAPQSKEFRKLVPLNVVFNREIRFYNEIYPELVRFQAERKVKKPFHHVPKVYTTCGTDFEETVVMEDIKQLGFSTYERKNLMNDEHIIHVLNLYGQFHAISFAMQDQNKELYDEITRDLDDVWCEFGPGLLGQIVANVGKTAELYCREGEEKEMDLIRKLEKESHDFMQNVMKIRSKYHVINHGDCWYNNMMFKYENEKLLDMRLIDFQLCRDSTPAYDLAYFMYVCTGKETLDNLDYYLGIYYDSLKRHCKDMGTDVEKLFPYSALKDDWKTYGKYGFIMALSIIKIVNTDDDDAIDLADAANEGGFEKFNEESKNQSIIDDRLRKLCDFVINNGFI